MSDGNRGNVISAVEGVQVLPELAGTMTHCWSAMAQDQLLLSPVELLDKLPAQPHNIAVVEDAREVIKSILQGKDKRLLVIVGPCSIHDYDSALDYAGRLRQLATSVSEQMYLVMRCYFEKPRTVTGWKGLINDPHLDESNDIATGVELVRRILLDITGLGVPVATEALEPNLAHYYQDLISWTAIGARTVESQLHRQFASGLASPVGVKNTTNGCIDTAVNALISIRTSHRYAGVNTKGQVSMVQTRGNSASHIILRGGHAGPNYDAESILRCKQMLGDKGIAAGLMVDCSHANSGKKASRQKLVVDELVNQITAGEDAIAGLMLESHIKPGAQTLRDNPKGLDYGVSITDECIGWQETAELLKSIADRLGQI